MSKLIVEIDVDDEDIGLLSTHTAGITFTRENRQVYFPAIRSIGYCKSCIHSDIHKFCSNTASIIDPLNGYCSDWDKGEKK